MTDTIDINEQLTRLLGGNPFDIRHIGVEWTSVEWDSAQKERPWQHDRWQVSLKECPGMGVSLLHGIGSSQEGKAGRAVLG